MTTESENRPHVTYHKETGAAVVHASYSEAFAMWKLCHERVPHAFSIRTLGRECTPGAPVIDVSE